MDAEVNVPTAGPSRRRRKPRKHVASERASVRPPHLLSLPSYLAGNVARIGHRLLLQVVERHGLRLPDYAVMTALSDFGPLAQYELSDCLDFERSHVVGFVDRLEQRGFVERERDPADRRRVVVSLTAAGQEEHRRLAKAATNSQTEFLGVLSRQEREALLGMLRRVLEADDAARLGLTDDPDGSPELVRATRDG